MSVAATRSLSVAHRMRHRAAEHACSPDKTCDSRIIRSKAALREALISLMEERGFDGFTVNDLCQRAGLNRGTFYNHFEGKDQLIQTCEEGVLSDLGVFGDKMSTIEVKDLFNYFLRKEPLPVLVELFDYLREESAFLHAVLGPGGDVRFGPRLRETICSQLIMSLLHDRYRKDPTPFVKYYIAYYAGAYLGLICHWIETGMEESSEEMALIAMRLLFIKPGESITL